jgi:NADPH2:quinone reductase
MNETSAIRMRSFGGPEVLEYVGLPMPQAGPGEVLVEQEAIGLNMIDTYYRSGLYAIELPSGIGSEAAGTVLAVGSGVDDVQVGARVAYVSPPPLDAYARHRIIARKWLVDVPDDVPSETAAAVMLKGLTAWYLLRRSYCVERGQWILLHAAAGGVGLLVAQWARQLGARIIGVVGSESKRAAALEAGCEHVLVGHADLAARVRGLTGGAGVPVAYDSVGRDTFMASLDCLQTHGYMVSFGNASGPVDPISPLELMRRGSLYLTRPTLFDFVRERSDLETGAAELFALVRDGSIRVSINQRYALVDAARAHADLEARRTTGSTVLLP